MNQPNQPQQPTGGANQVTQAVQTLLVWAQSLIKQGNPIGAKVLNLLKQLASVIGGGQQQQPPSQPQPQQQGSMPMNQAPGTRQMPTA